MPLHTTILLSAAIFGVALLYSTVGHAGASGYLACMALAGMAPEVMKPTALALNVFVASVATYKYFSAGLFNWRTLWPFAATSIPFSFLGGAVTLPGDLYKKVVAAVLVYSALRLVLTATSSEGKPVTPPPIGAGLALGAILGFVSGLTGVGGGIFLSPILLFAGWCDARLASGTAAVFILVNSIAGLCGHLSSISFIGMDVAWWAPSAIVGGWIGSHVGSKKLPGPAIRRFLAAVILIAALKMLFA